MDLGLEGKVALVTGASRGIGAAIARELAREGVALSLVARDAAALGAVAAGIADLGSKASHVSLDLRDPAAPAAAVAAALEAHGRVDILVNCAGATKRGDFFSLDDEDWADGFALKFYGTVRMSRSAWPHLKKTHGSVINVVGIGSRTPSADFTIGGSVNSALLNFSKALAHIGKRDGVRVNVINPGYIETDRLKRRIDIEMRERGHSREEAVASLLAELNIDRFGQPEEIGYLAAFIASGRGAYLHGSTIDIDGGETPGL